MNEIWKPIVGYEGIYEVSDLGSIRRVGGWSDGRPNRFNRVLKLNAKRYMRISLCRDGVHKDFPVHRLVYIAFHGPMPLGTEINHINGEKYDNRLANLECVTHSQNVAHRYAVLGHKGRPGSKHHMAKLTEAQVLEIRRLCAPGVFHKVVAAKFGVCTGTIDGICARKTWRHI